MSAVRIKLIDKKHLPENSPKLIDTLDFVAVGTVADCVSMAKSNANRALVKYGLQIIDQGKRPCWQSILPLLSTPANAEDLGFKIGPLLNSDGRLACAFGSVSFLLSKSREEADQWIEHLQLQNNQRKSIQKEITKLGISKAHHLVKSDKKSLCIYIENGHAGIHGIAASRIKDYYGRPTVFLTPKLTDPNLISGSARGIEGFHVRDALQYVYDNTDNIITAFGGHTGAGGVTLKKSGLVQFMKCFEQATIMQINKNNLKVGPVVFTDGEINEADINLEILEQIEYLQPFGREFEAPIFQANAIITDLNIIGDGTHARLELKIGEKIFKAVWFGMRHSESTPVPVQVGDQLLAAFMIKANSFRKIKRCELQILTFNR